MVRWPQAANSKGLQNGKYMYIFIYLREKIGLDALRIFKLLG